MTKKRSGIFEILLPRPPVSKVFPFDVVVRVRPLIMELLVSAVLKRLPSPNLLSRPNYTCNIEQSFEVIRIEEHFKVVLKKMR
jgi:hypothetical protein